MAIKTVFATATGGFTVPADFKSLVAIHAVGAGGGGSGGQRTTPVIGGGGGGGGNWATTTSLSPALTASQACFVSIGAGGTGGTGSQTSATSGGTGGDSWFNTTNTAPSSSNTGCLARGGVGASTTTGGAGGPNTNIGTSSARGGTGGSGTANANWGGGGGGGAGGTHGVGANGGVPTGSGQVGGGGGGGADGGAAGGNAVNTAAGVGGNSRSGSGGGAASTAGTNGGGGGGGNAPAGAGGLGGREAIWTQTSDSFVRGFGGGNGAGGGRSSGTPGGSGGSGAGSGCHGGGGGGGGTTFGSGNVPGNGGAGQPGLIVFIYEDDWPTATAGSSTITQTGSAQTFLGATANSGTVSSTITVPSDAQIVVVGLQGWSADANYFTNMTFTKGGSDTAMTRVGTPEPGNGQTAAIFYLVLPDTGSNKSLKYDWAGTNVPGETPIISVTFWKGINTASPVRSSGASAAAVADSSFKPRTTTMLTAQNGDLVVAFVGGDTGSTAVDGTVNTWFNLNEVTELTNTGLRHDGAWGSFAPSGNLGVGANTSTSISYGVCAAIVLQPSTTVTGTLGTTEAADTVALAGAVTDRIVQVGSLLEFRPGSSANAGTVSTTITVPAGTDFITVGVSSYRAEVGYVTGGSMTFTKGGVDTAMTVASNLSDTNTSGYMGALFYLASPDVGSNKTLKWDMQGSAVADFSFHHIFSITFWQGVEIAAPVRSASGFNAAAAPPWNTGTLTAQAGDKIIAYAHAFANAADGSVTTWNNLTELSEITWDNPSDGAWATSLPTGNTTVGVQAATNWDDGGISAIVVKPFTGATAVTGTLATTEAADTAAMPGGSVSWVATLAATETRDAVAFNGTVQWIVTLAATETRDAVVFNGTVQWPATLAASEASDVASLLGSTAWTAALATTEASDTAAMVGSTVWAVTLAATEAKDVAAATGTVQWVAALAASEATDTAAFTGAIFNPATGTLTVTEAADAVAFTGGILGTGTLAVSEAVDVAALVGSVAWTGTLAASEAADVAAFVGGTFGTGTLAASEAPDAVAFAGNAVTLGTMAASEVPDVAALTGTAILLAALAATEAKDTVAFVGSVQWTATLAASEAPDTAAFPGSVAWAAALAASEAKDTAAFVGGTYGAGVLATTEASDTFEAVVTVFDQGGGALFAHEAPDGVALAGTVSGLAGVLGASEAADVAALAGQIAWAGVLAASEAKDTGAAVGSVAWGVTLAASEAPDMVAVAGGVYASGVLAATEAPDRAVFTSGLIGGGALDAIEQADGAALSVTASWLVALAATEAADVAAFTSTTELNGVLATVEPSDQATIVGGAVSEGILEATEKPDTARFTTRPPDIQDAPGYILQRSDRRVRLLASENQRVRNLKYPIPRPRELLNSYDRRARDFAGRRARSLVRE